jgi:anti-sigma regulatory factor (Ser/Thr protein kinase)
VTNGPAAASVSNRLVLAPDPRAVGNARQFVRACAEAAGMSGDALDVVVLLTSEAVTNAFIHGRSEARLSVTVRPGGVLVEVGDDTRRTLQPLQPPPDALGGRGLAILDTLASQWGVRDDAYGKVVWFEVG